MKALVDLRPLRENRTFRRLWIGSTASGFGGQFGAFASVYYLWDTTHRAAVVGLLGLAIAAPLILLSLVGSAFIDHVDRRRLAMRCTGGQILVGAAMTAVVFTGVGGVPAVLGLAATASALGALGNPARRAFIPALLSGQRLAAGLALNHLSFQLAMLLGPAAAGGLTALAGVGWCFAFDTLTFGAALIGLAGLPSGVPASPGRAGIRAVRAGLAYAARTPAVRGALLADLVATLFAMPIALFPVVNAELFGDRPEILGLFTTALAAGGVTASVLSGLATGRPHPGRLMLTCGAVWALALGGLGLVALGPRVVGTVGTLSVVLLLVAVAGAADTWAVVARGTVVQSTTPDAYRGRVSALEAMVGEAGPQLGNLRAGLVASATSGGAALAIGGATALAATVLIAVSTPALRRFTVPDEGALTGSDLHG
ncbi:MFS family permease [Actinoplanes tereljensis]|uniref:MFS transporter n=1 Tax=Paractinoplanes tereljensis TaxID=571912 RepID=A0A919NLT6_9ACTN|nr:MFS transporter [Actinoplanes tereljensis]GIF20490.1 MFS transporter [Actinoplanes tereljensis]